MSTARLNNTASSPSKLKQLWNDIKHAVITVNRKIQSGFSFLSFAISRGWYRFTNSQPHPWVRRLVVGIVTAIVTVVPLGLIFLGLANPLLALVTFPLFFLLSAVLYKENQRLCRAEQSRHFQPAGSSTAEVGSRLGDHLNLMSGIDLVGPPFNRSSSQPQAPAPVPVANQVGQLAAHESQDVETQSEPEKKAGLSPR